MKIRNALNKKLTTVMALAYFIVVFANSCDSESRKLEKHGYEFAQSDFEQIDWDSPNAGVMGRNIAREMAHDVHELRTGTSSPMEKYNMNTMYCTAAATHAIKEAQNQMNMDKEHVNVFENLPKYGMTNGYTCIDFWRNTYGDKVPGCVVVIKDPVNTEISKTEKQFKKILPGSVVRYYGHYNDGKKHAHTQMYLGQGYCDEGRYVPTKRGKTVMGAGYKDAFKYLETDIKDKYAGNSGQPGHPILDSIVVINTAKIMEYQATR